MTVYLIVVAGSPIKAYYTVRGAQKDMQKLTSLHATIIPVELEDGYRAIQREANVAKIDLSPLRIPSHTMDEMAKMISDDQRWWSRMYQLAASLVWFSLEDWWLLVEKWLSLSNWEDEVLPKDLPTAVDTLMSSWGEHKDKE